MFRSLSAPFRRSSSKKTSTSKPERATIHVTEDVAQSAAYSGWTIGECFTNYNAEHGIEEEKEESEFQKARKKTANTDYEIPLNSGEVILYLYGCFNPIHTQHVQSIVEAKEWLEKDTMYKIVGSFLTLAPDAACAAKVLKDPDPVIFKFEHRKKMAEIATKHLDWLQIYPEPAKNQSAMRPILRKKLKKPKAKCAVVFGADRFVREDEERGILHANSNDKEEWFAVCVGREGMPENVNKWIQRNQGQNAPIGFYVVPKMLPNVSSTEIRVLLQKFKNEKLDVAKAAILSEMTEKGWFSEECAEYLFKNCKTLMT